MTQATGEPRWDIFDTMLDAAVVLDRAGVVAYANRAAAQLFGVATPAGLAGGPLQQWLPARHHARQARRLAQAFAGAISLDRRQQVCVRRHDGSELPVEIAWSWLGPARSGSLLGVLRDHTERRAIRRSLRTALRLQMEFDCATVCSLRLDGRGMITHVNEAWRRFARDNGADAATIHGVGLDYLAASRSDADPAARSVVAGIEALLAGERAHFEQVYSCHSPTRLRWFRLEARRPPITSRAVVLTHVDITAQHKAEAHSRLQACVSDAYASRKPLLDACRELAKVACRELEWDFMGTWVLDAPSWSLRCADVWSRPGLEFPEFVRANQAARLAPGVGLPGLAWQTRKPLWTTATALDVDVEEGSRRSAAMPAVAMRAGFRSGFAFAVKCDDDVLAVIEVFGRLEQARDATFLHLLEVAGEQLGTAELRERAERRAEAAQAEADAAREELEAVLECAPALVVAIDRDGAVRFVNRPSDGRPRDEVVGLSWRHVIPEASQPQVERALATVLDGGPTQTFEVTTSGTEGRPCWSANFMGPIRRGPGITGALIVSQDVTQIKTAQQELFAAQRLAAIGTLAAGIAHEINTPIQFLGDNIEFLREASAELLEVIEKHQNLRELAATNDNMQAAYEAAQATEARADLEYLRSEIPRAFDGCREGLQRVSSIVRSMKEFSHPADKDMAPVELNRAVEATLTVARSEYKYVADVQTQLGELPPVTCHINDINQVVLNIVVNAAHAIADRYSGTEERGLIRVSTWQDGADVVISIADNGGGIPLGARERIFEPFFTTKEVGRGTGQGLAIAWAAVTEKHGGELTFESRLGEGTTFFIRLPVSGEVEREPPALEADELPTGSTRP